MKYSFPLLLLLAIGCDSDGSKNTSLRSAELVVAGAGDVQDVVLAELKSAAQEKRRLIVYVGATWCEPCRYFVEAVKTGKLPSSLSALRFLKFDHDQDDERLSKAGYGGDMIPRFVVPSTSGLGTDRRFEGSIKGPEAVANIVPKLRSILDRDRHYPLADELDREQTK